MIKSIDDEIGEHDSANIYCNIFITKIDEDEFEELDENWDENEGEPPSKWAKYELTADIFMPRKGLYNGAAKYIASTREELQELVRERILPSYEIGLQAMKDLCDGKRGSFYYWGPTTPSDMPKD